MGLAPLCAGAVAPTVMDMTETAFRLQIPTDEVDRALHARGVLGPDSEAGVIDAFLERTGTAIDARVDARLATDCIARSQPLIGSPPLSGSAPQQPRRGDQSGLALALGSMVLAIPLTGIATPFGYASVLIVFAIWAAIVAVNVSYNRRR